MAALKPESKREEFRRYLEKSGVMDALTRVLVSLYEEPERPQNAIDYFLDRLATGAPAKAEMDTLETEVNDLKKKAAQLEEENEQFRRRLQQYEPTTNGGGEEGAAAGSEGASTAEE